jgi:hypothetical protein
VAENAHRQKGPILNLELLCCSSRLLVSSKPLKLDWDPDYSLGSIFSAENVIAALKNGANPLSLASWLSCDR